MMINGIVAGIDGGGSKTLLRIESISGKVILQRRLGPLNLNGNDIAQIERTLNEAFSTIALINEEQPCHCICIAASGSSNPSTNNMIQCVAKHQGIKARLLLVGDQEAAFAGAANGGPGIILISGTGSICFGLNEKGEEARSGGWGHIIGDQGSGYAIGRDILMSVAKAEDGVLPPTVFTSLVKAATRASGRSELISWLYAKTRNKSDIAALSRLLEPALEAGDDAAKKILNDSVKSLAGLVISVAAKLKMKSGNYYFAGSVLINSQPISSEVEKLLAAELPKFIKMQTKKSPVEGAVLLARCALENV